MVPQILLDPVVVQQGVVYVQQKDDRIAQRLSRCVRRLCYAWKMILSTRSPRGPPAKPQSVTCPTDAPSDALPSG
jgi:hypothetical protein